MATGQQERSAIRTAQEVNGSIMVVLPKDMAEDRGIDAGTPVYFEEDGEGVRAERYRG